jgi:acetylornithine/succinyldiaminopimelate/putrescine aminotransferase
MVQKLAQDLVVTLSSITKLFTGFSGAEAFTSALKEHSQLKSDFIIFPQGKRSFGARKGRYTVMDLDHRLSPSGQVV